MAHKFFVGQEVYFTPILSVRPPADVYKILGLMPIEGDDLRRYRIKSASEPYERIAEEVQLAAE